MCDEVQRAVERLSTAVRVLYGLVGGEGFRAACRERWDPVEALMRSRSTQTNEPGRCAALLEVGASAGLCLLPDFSMYDYGAGGSAPAGRGGSRR